jgi:hypothetical protein
MMLDVSAMLLAFMIVLDFLGFALDLARKMFIALFVRVLFVPNFPTVRPFHRAAAGLMVLSTVFLKLRLVMALSFFF